jgi:hypothetical protein
VRAVLVADAGDKVLAQAQVQNEEMLKQVA